MIVKLIAKNGTNGYDIYQVGKDIPDIRKSIKCVCIERSLCGYTVVGSNAHIEIKEDFTVKVVSIDKKNNK